ncbi:MAG: hypothetical protein WAN22_04860 [Solirubrobacteraceae bacterium]
MRPDCAERPLLGRAASSSRGGNQSGSGGSSSQSQKSSGSGSGGNKAQKAKAGRKGGKKSSSQLTAHARSLNHDSDQHSEFEELRMATTKPVRWPS